jgi:hypothetical protein
VPAAALAGEGDVLVQTTRTFSPAGDPRRLGLRVLSCRVEAVSPALSR